MTKAYEAIQRLLESDMANSDHVIIMSPQVRNSMPNEERMMISEIATSLGIQIHVDRLIERDRVLIMKRDFYEEQARERKANRDLRIVK